VSLKRPALFLSMIIPRKARVFWPLLLIVLLADCSTKEIAESTLLHPGASRDVAGEFLRFTLVYNTGAAMGLLGSWAKEILGVVGIGATVMFFGWYRRAAAGATALAAALALVMAGAMGNAWQRLLAPRGVVDFIDIGLGDSRFWVFNVADIAVHAGAMLLFVVLWREERRLRARG
jgi:signal peptidase II